jgi:hypothetical protein
VLAANFFVQCLWSYVSAVRPGDGSPLYPRFLEERPIPQRLKNRPSSNILREVHVATSAIIEFKVPFMTLPLKSKTALLPCYSVWKCGES